MCLRLTRRRFLISAGFAAAAGGLGGCISTNKATGRSSFTGVYSVEDDIRLGRQEHPKMLAAFGGEYDSRLLKRYVERVGSQLAVSTEYQQFPYRFTVLNSPIVNAFALPGGYVYISRGLIALAGNEAEMAGVLAHELGHVNARHTAERMSASSLAQIGVLAGAIGAAALGLPGELAQAGQQVAVASIQSYSRKQEFEADMLGVRYMSKAGYDPVGMVSFLITLREQSMVEARSMGLPAGTVDEFNMMSTHPRTVDRVQEATAAAEVQRPAQPILGRQEYLANIDGMMFGDDPSQGVVIGRRFVHPGMRFEFQVPAGFRVRNEPDQILAQGADRSAVVFDLGVARTGDMTQYLQRDWAGQIQLQDVQAISVNDMTGATGWTTIENGGRRFIVRLVAIRRDARSAYRLQFVALSDRYQALKDEFRATTYSVKALSADQAAKVRPLRLRVIRATGNEDVSALSANLPYGAFNDDWFRVLNDLPQGRQPVANQPLKLIET